MSRPRTALPTLADLQNCARTFPVFGLGSDFAGERFVSSWGQQDARLVRLGLGHGDPHGRYEDPCLTVGIEAKPEPGIQDLIAGLLVFDVNEPRYFLDQKLQQQISVEERRELTKALTAQEIPAVQWSEIELKADGRRLSFRYADMGNGTWGAFREHPDAYVYIHAHRWAADATSTALTRIHDLTPYLKGAASAEATG